MNVPPGWRATNLGALGRYLNGRGFKKSEWRESGRPIIRIQNLTGSGASFNYYQGDVEDRYVARHGDLLVSWAATLGAYIWSGPEAVVNQHIFKVESNIDRRFHKYLLDYKLADLMRHTHGSGMVHITRGRFDSEPVCVPSDLREQRRIVEILEDHLSRLDAADAELARVRVRLDALQSSALSGARGGDLVPLAEVSEIQGGIQKQPRRAPRTNHFPFLRVANVTSTGLDLREVHRVELFNDELTRLRLQRGDLLVVEGNGSASQIGRAATWDGSLEDCVHQNHLIRVRPNAKVLPAYLEAVWNSPESRRQLTSLASSSSGLHTLSVSKLKQLRIPLPSVDEQRSRLSRVEDIRSGRARISATLEQAKVRSSRLRRAVLASAFEGTLTGRHTDDDLIDETAFLEGAHHGG